MMNVLLRAHEWTVLALAGAGGLAWGVASLLVGFSWFFARATGSLRAILTLLTLPLHTALWLGAAFRLPIVDPTGLVLGTGLLLGLGLAVVLLAIVRWRER